MNITSQGTIMPTNQHSTANDVVPSLLPRAAGYESIAALGTLLGDGAPRVNGPITILLAEDDDDLREVTAAVLEMMGYAVVARADAWQASEAFRSHPGISLLLADLEMPGRSGMDLAREVTGLQPTLPVIVVSGSLLPVALLLEIRTKHWMFLSKPYELSVLRDAISLRCAPSYQKVA